MPPVKRGQTARRRSPRTNSKEAPESLEVQEVTVEIEDLASYNDSVNILLYGPSGHGKTVLAGGAPNATFLSTEKGVVSAKRSGSKAHLIRTPTWEHVVAGLDLADTKLGKDDCLIVDSVTKMQVLYLRWILRMQHEMNSSRDLDIPAIQDHQKWQNGFKRFWDRIIDSDYNSILVATAMLRENKDGEEMYLPDIYGKDYSISNYCSAQADVILYYAISERASDDDHIVRRALAQPFPPYLAKDRYDVLGPFQDVEPGDYKAMAKFVGMIQRVS